MKLHVKKDWTKKFFSKQDNPGETIPIGPLPKLCGCGNLITEKDCDFCSKCIDGYRGEDEI